MYEEDIILAEMARQRKRPCFSPDKLFSLINSKQEYFVNENFLAENSIDLSEAHDTGGGGTTKPAAELFS